MRLRCFAIVAASFVLVHSTQTSYSIPPSTSSTTVVDVLGDDPDYTHLLRLLQRTRLIPTLNRLSNCTLFAPTNDAIERYSASHSLWQSVLDSEDFVPDNVQEKLRQQLFYHLLNYTPSALPVDNGIPVVLETLHFPHAPQPPSKDPPPSPPWLPLPEGTLGGRPQKLRIVSKDNTAWVGVDARGKGGAKIVKGVVNAGNGILLGIADVLEPPKDLATVISQHDSLSYFHNILTPETTALLSSTPNLTIFLAVNEAWKSLHPYERIYLASPFATDDLNRIVGMHAVSADHVTWSDGFDPATNLTTMDGSTLEIVVAPEKTIISTAALVQPDVYASNGVLHIVDSLLIPEGALQITPEKVLLAYNCTSFVSFLHSVDLTSLINDTNTKYTILAPRDDVFSIYAENGLPEPGSEELRRMLKYHFIPGKWTENKLVNGMLLPTALDEPGLRGGAQVIGVDVDVDGLTGSTIKFGGASIVDGDPIEVNGGHTVMYFLSRPLSPPADAFKVARPKLDFSSFLQAMLSTSVGETVKSTPSTTLLLPHNSAFERLGLLVSGYLLAETSSSDLESVLLHHTIDGVEYAKSLVNGSIQSIKTLEGSDLHIDRTKNGSIFLQASGGWNGLRAQLHPTDTLTKTGVIHELSDILIPRSVNLTIGKLVKAANGNTMANIVTKAGMDWVLNGQPPPEGSRWDGLSGAGWTLLCPTDDAFKKINLTELYADTEGLERIVDQHLVPLPGNSGKAVVSDDPLYNNRPLTMEDSATYSTLHSPSSAYGDIVFRFQSQEDGSKEEGYVVGIKGARGTDGEADSAKVLSWGRSTTGSGTGGVIQIDRMLIPYQPSFWREYGAPGAFGAFGIIGLCYFFYIANLFWRKDTTEATYEPVGGFTGDEDS